MLGHLLKHNRLMDSSSYWSFNIYTAGAELLGTSNLVMQTANKQQNFPLFQIFPLLKKTKKKTKKVFLFRQSLF